MFVQSASLFFNSPPTCSPLTNNWTKLESLHQLSMGWLLQGPSTWPKLLSTWPNMYYPEVRRGTSPAYCDKTNTCQIKYSPLSLIPPKDMWM